MHFPPNISVSVFPANKNLLAREFLENVRAHINYDAAKIE